MVIGKTSSLVISVCRAPVLQAGSPGFESCNRQTFSSLVYLVSFTSAIIKNPGKYSEKDLISVNRVLMPHHCA